MQTGQVNSLKKWEDSRHIQPLWVSTQLDAQEHQFDCEVNSGAGCSIMPLYIYWLLFRDKKPNPPKVLVKNLWVMYSCTSHWKSGTMESTVPGHRHNRISHPWLWNCTTDRLHTFPKGNSTKVDTTTQDTWSPEGHNSKGIKMGEDK